MNSSFYRQTISADFKLSLNQRVLWLFRNFGHLFLSFFKSSRHSLYSYVKSKNIYGEIPDDMRSKVVSPSRALCSLSLVNLFHISFEDRIKRGIMSLSVLDYGCGNSNMISIIEDSLSLINENTRCNFIVNIMGLTHIFQAMLCTKIQKYIYQ